MIFTVPNEWNQFIKMETNYGWWLKTLDFYVYFFPTFFFFLEALYLFHHRVFCQFCHLGVYISARYLSTISNCESIHCLVDEVTKQFIDLHVHQIAGRWEVRVNSEWGRSNRIRRTFENVHRFIKLAGIQRTRGVIRSIVACETAILQFVREGRKSEIYPKVFEITFSNQSSCVYVPNL